MNTLWTLSFPWWHFVVRAAVVYFSVILLLRLGGKRQVGQMGVGEFVVILLISNAVQNAMNGGDNSITGGLLLALVLVLLSLVIAYGTYKSPKMEMLVEGRPQLLVHHGKIVMPNLDKEWLTVSELRTMLRRQGIFNLTDVHEAVLESNGSLSVIHASDLMNPTKD